MKTKTFNLAKAAGFSPRCEGDSIHTVYQHLPPELHPAARWLVARLGLYPLCRYLEIGLENQEEFGEDAFEHHVLYRTVELLSHSRVAGDLAYALGMVFHGTWDEVPKPYSLALHRRDGYAALVDCGILVPTDKDEYTMPECWQKYLWLRGRFVWGDKPYDITTDHFINCRIYAYELKWCKQKPPGWKVEDE